MARYIDADALVRVLNAKADMAMGTPKEVFFSVAKMVDYLPAADVISKEFLTRKEDEAYERGYAEGKTDASREIFEEIESVLCRSVYPRVNANRTITPISSKDWHIRCDDYNAIKKKYTEVE